jgi:hypothetical protein
MQIDQTVVTAILALLGSGIVTALVQALKTWLKSTWFGSDAGARVLAGVLSIGGTAYVLISQHIFTILALVIYGAVVFGSSTGLFKLTAGAPAPKS